MTFVFVSGDLALDFAGTLKWRRAVPAELLATPADAARWAVEAGVLTAAPELSTVDLDGLLELREAVYRLAVATLAERAWPVRDLRALNAAAAEPPPVARLTTGGIRRAGGATAIGAAVATAAVGLLGTAGTPGAGPIRECALDECTRLFVDRSRAGNRAWCGMEECGNRVKAAAYRARRGAAQSTATSEAADQGAGSSTGEGTGKGTGEAASRSTGEAASRSTGGAASRGTGGAASRGTGRAAGQGTGEERR